MGDNQLKNILLLDTIGEKTIVGFFDGKKLHMKTLRKASSNKLHSAISKLVSNFDIRISDLRSIGALAGPGSFTGVRIGVTIANALAYALKIPIFATDSLTAQVPLETNKTSPKRSPTSRDVRSRTSDSAKFLEADQYHTITLPASHSEVYSAKFKNGKMVGKIELIPKAEAEHCSVSTKSNYRVKNLLDLILSDKIKPQKQILPLYIKKPNITTSNKKTKK